MEFCRPLERPLVMIVGPPLRVGPTIMTAGRSAGRQNSITPSQIMLLLYYHSTILRSFWYTIDGNTMFHDVYVNSTKQL